jgi:hypothetical protein
MVFQIGPVDGPEIRAQWDQEVADMMGFGLGISSGQAPWDLHRLRHTLNHLERASLDG